MMRPRGFLEGDHDRNITVDQYRAAMGTDIEILSVDKKWKVLSYYYDDKKKCYVLDIEELNSTYQEGWNAVLKNYVEDGEYKRSDGNKEYKRGWDDCKKAKNPDWIEDEQEAKYHLKRK